MSTHPTAEDLADAVAGVLTAEQSAEVDRHVASCADCAATAHRLQIVRAVLAEDSATLRMPAEVAVRLDAALAAESARRSSGETGRVVAQRQAAHAKRLSLGSFGENAPTKRHTGTPEVDGAVDRDRADTTH